MTRTCSRCGASLDATSVASHCATCNDRPSIAQTSPVGTGARHEESVLFSLASLRDVAAVQARSASRAPIPASSPSIAHRAAVRHPASSVDQILTVGCAQTPLAPIALVTPEGHSPSTPRRANRTVVLASAAAAILVVNVALAATVLTRAPAARAHSARPTVGASIATSAPTQTNTAIEYIAPVAAANPPTIAARIDPPTHSLRSDAHSQHATHVVQSAASSTARVSASTPMPSSTTGSQCIASCRGDADCLMRCSVAGATARIGSSLSSHTQPEVDLAPHQDLPAAPARASVLAALTSVRSAVEGCARGHAGTATITVTFAGSGHVTTATVAAPYAGTPEGSCMARAVRSATLPSFARATFTASYPFAIQ